MQGIQDLIEISQFYGKDKEYVIAGGGNTSFKNDEFLWIKASGIALSDIDENGFVRMSREKLKVISEKEYSSNSDEREAQVKTDLAAAIDSQDGLRPSVETSMHDVINFPFVIHTHPTVVNALTCSNNSKELSFKILGEDILFIEYTDPGYVLFKKVADAINDFESAKGYVPRVILLENHGIFVSGNTIEEVKELYHLIEEKILGYMQAMLPDDTLNTFVLSNSQLFSNIYKEEGKAVKSFTGNLIELFVKDDPAFAEIATAFTPDHIVYCKSKYLFLDDINEKAIAKQISDFEKNFGFKPRIIGLKGKGLIIVADSEKSAGIIIELIMNMMKISWLASKLEGSKPMTKEQIAFIENWEVENYRKKMAEKGNK